MDTRPVPCAALDGVSFAAADQPMRSGSYAVATAPSPGSFPSTASPACTIAVQAWPTAPQKTTPQEGVTLYFPEDSTQVQKAKRRFVRHFLYEQRLICQDRLGTKTHYKLKQNRVDGV